MKYVLSAFVMVLTAGLSAAAPDPVAIELKGLVDDVASVLRKQDQTSIRIGKFTGDGDVPSHFGPEIQRLLIAGFKTNNVTVSKDALIEIKGDYAPATEDPSAPGLNQMFVRISAKLVNTKTRLELAGVSIVSRAIHGNEALAKAFAPTTTLPPSADRQTRNDGIRDAIEKPNANVANTKVRSSASSPFAVEILVVNTATAPNPAAGVPVSLKDGLAFVDVKKGQSYRVKIHNGADFDVAVKLSIDGLDQYVFADNEHCKPDGTSKFEYLIIPKRSTYAINGWFRNLKRADAFTVDDYAKGAVAELNASQGDVGQIAVAFHAAWDTEEELRKESAKDAATRRGDPVDTNLKLVSKFIGVCRDQVSVRYLK